MDNTETYIKMCGKAEKIQELGNKRILAIGDYIANADDGEFHYAVLVFNGHYAPRYLHYIWLPRQDQLQAMLKWNTPFYHMIIELSEFYRSTLGVGEFKSWEQIWLAFVMKEKYNKVWDGAKWVNEI